MKTSAKLSAFLTKTGATLSATQTNHKQITEELINGSWRALPLAQRRNALKIPAAQFNCTIKRGVVEFYCVFTESIAETEKHYFPQVGSLGKYKPMPAPSAESVFYCLQKYPVGTFEDFASEFGYDEDSRKAEQIYKAVKQEVENMQRLFSYSELEELIEIFDNY